MNFRVLHEELVADPLGFGYSTLSDTETANKLNATTTGRTLARTAIPKREVLNAIVNAEWPGTAILQNKLLVIMSVDFLDASNPNVQGVIGSIFGAGTQTRANLLALANRTVSRAEELGLGVVLATDVSRARAGGW